MPSLLYAGENDTLAIYQRDGSTGDLTRTGTASVGGKVRSFCTSPDGYRMFVATDAPAVLSFTVDQASGELAPAEGAPVPMPLTPCFMTPDRSGRWLLVASYNQPGHACVLSVNASGVAVGPPVSVIDDLRHTSHCIGIDASNRYAFVPCVAAANHTNGAAPHKHPHTHARAHT